MLFRNTARSPWRRSNNELVPTGETFEAGEVEAAAIIRRNFIFLVPVGEAQPEATGRQDQTGGGTEPPPDWPFKTSPQKYLKHSPNGPQAGLARLVLGVKA